MEDKRINIQIVGCGTPEELATQLMELVKRLVSTSVDELVTDEEGEQDGTLVVDIWKDEVEE
jgi:hypothetical protein